MIHNTHLTEGGSFGKKYKVKHNLGQFKNYKPMRDGGRESNSVNPDQKKAGYFAPFSPEVYSRLVHVHNRSRRFE